MNTVIWIVVIVRSQMRRQFTSRSHQPREERDTLLHALYQELFLRPRALRRIAGTAEQPQIFDVIRSSLRCGNDVVNGHIPFGKTNAEAAAGPVLFSVERVQMCLVAGKIAKIGVLRLISPWDNFAVLIQGNRGL